MTEEPRSRPRLYTVRDVVQLTGTSDATVRRWIREELLEVVRWGPTRRIRITREVLMHFFGPLDSL